MTALAAQRSPANRCACGRVALPLVPCCERGEPRASEPLPKPTPPPRLLGLEVVRPSGPWGEACALAFSHDPYEIALWLCKLAEPSTHPDVDFLPVLQRVTYHRGLEHKHDATASDRACIAFAARRYRHDFGDRIDRLVRAGRIPRCA